MGKQSLWSADLRCKGQRGSLCSFFLVSFQKCHSCTLLLCLFVLLSLFLFFYLSFFLNLIFKLAKTFSIQLLVSFFSSPTVPCPCRCSFLLFSACALQLLFHHWKEVPANQRQNKNDPLSRWHSSQCKGQAGSYFFLSIFLSSFLSFFPLQFCFLGKKADVFVVEKWAKKMILKTLELEAGFMLCSLPLCLTAEVWNDSSVSPLPSVAPCVMTSHVAFRPCDLFPLICACVILWSDCPTLTPWPPHPFSSDYIDWYSPP